MIMFVDEVLNYSSLNHKNKIKNCHNLSSFFTLPPRQIIEVKLHSNINYIFLTKKILKSLEKLIHSVNASKVPVGTRHLKEDRLYDEGKIE